MIFVEAVVRIEGYGQSLVLQERAVQPETIVRIGTTLALHADVWRAASTKGTEAEVPRQGVLEVQVHVALEAMILGIQLVGFALVIIVATSSIDGNAHLVSGVPVEPNEKVGGLCTTDVGIRAVLDSVLHEGIALDAVVYQTIAQVDVGTELGTERVDAQSEAVRLGWVEVRITIVYAGRVAGVAERVQQVDARAGDTHLIREPFKQKGKPRVCRSGSLDRRKR